MPVSKRKIATNNAWTSKHFDRISLAIKKEGSGGVTLEAIRDAAAAEGVSVNAWILEAIRRRLNN